MEKRNNNNINFKEFDSFIQNCLDKYFYVEPWKKLYDRTGRFHRDIISDKSTIPDLIIYNKSFNKSDCFYESNFKSYVKFPRMRFILRPKYKKEYNPKITYGNEEDAVLYYYKYKNKKDLGDNLNKNLNLNQINNSPKVEKTEIQNKKTFLKENKMDEEEEEEEPEWANDNVEDFNKIKIKFKAIPETLEKQINKDIKFNYNSNNNTKLEIKEKNIVDIDKFFIGENLEQNPVPEDETVNNNYNNFDSFIGNTFINNNIINNKNNKNNSGKNIKNFPDNNNLIKSENSLNINTIKNSNEYFDIFDTENKYKNIYIEDENSYNNDNNSNNNNESKDGDIDFFDLSNRKEAKDKIIQKNNNLNNNSNYLNNNYLINNQNLINRRSMNNNYINNLNNINRSNLINPLSYNNINLLGMNIPNNTNYSKINHNNMYLPNNDQYIENNKGLYIKNLNNILYRYNLQNQLLNNINNNYIINQNSVFHNIIPINNNINSIPASYMHLNQNFNYNPFPFNYSPGIRSNVNRNIINNINNNVNINSLRQSNNNTNINYYQNKNEQKINYLQNLNKNVEIPENINPLEFSENPTDLVMLKNINKKKWIVFEKDKGNYIHNFNTKELYEYLEENNTEESFNNITINDSETDYYFPTKEIYDNLKKFYSKNL